MSKSLPFKKWSQNGLNKNSPADNFIIKILPDNRGNLWIASHKGLDRFNIENEKFERWKYKNDDVYDLESEGINALIIDKFDNLWVGTYTKGIVLIDQKTNEYIRLTKENNELSNIKGNHIQYFYEDNLGLIWVGTKFEGIFKYNNNFNVFNKWPKNQQSLIPLSNKYILSFFEDDNDNYWVGSKLEGLFKVNSKTGEITNYQNHINQKSTKTFDLPCQRRRKCLGCRN